MDVVSQHSLVFLGTVCDRPVVYMSVLLIVTVDTIAEVRVLLPRGMYTPLFQRRKIFLNPLRAKRLLFVLRRRIGGSIWSGD